MGHPLPSGAHTITPHMIVKGAAEAIEFYKRAFGAEELGRMPFQGPDGTQRIMHAALQIGDSRIFLVDEMPEHGALGPGKSSPVTIHLYVTDADAAFTRAVNAGAKVKMPLANMFWGDRYGQVLDPFGHHWSIAEHLEDLAPQQIAERMGAAMSGSGPGCN